MDLDNITLMKDFVREKGGVFVHPGGIDAKDTIFQVDENDMITETAVDGLYGYKTRVMNHRFWVGTIRHAIEQIHAVIKAFRFFTSPIHHRLLEPIGSSMVNSYG